MSKSVQLVSHSLKQQGFALLPFPPSHWLATLWLRWDHMEESSTPGGQSRKAEEAWVPSHTTETAVTQLRVLHAREVNLSF